MEATGDVAVEEVGGAQRGEEPGGVGSVIAGEEQPEEDRQQAQPDEGDDVGDGEDAIGPLVAAPLLGHRPHPTMNP